MSSRQVEAGYPKFSLTVLLIICFEKITIVDVFLSTTLLMILNVIVFKNIFTNTNLKALLIYILPFYGFQILN